MAKYAILFPVSPRMEAKFTKEELELAAKIAFYSDPPYECQIPDQELKIDWDDNFYWCQNIKVIRVIGDVRSPDHN